MVLLVALVVAAVVVPVWTIVTRLVQRRGRPAPADQQLADEARRAANLRQDDSRIEMERTRGQQWPPV